MDVVEQKDSTAQTSEQFFHPLLGFLRVEVEELGLFEQVAECPAKAAGEVADMADGGAQSEEPDTAVDETPEDADEEDVEIDDSDLDEQTYEEDDDVFIPTEEIPADEPIPFPSNI